MRSIHGLTAAMSMGGSGTPIGPGDHCAGSKENDQKVLREGGKVIDKTTRKYELVAEGLVRGLQLLLVDVREKEMTYTVVYGFRTVVAEAVKKVDSDHEAPSDRSCRDAYRYSLP